MRKLDAAKNHFRHATEFWCLWRHGSVLGFSRFARRSKLALWGRKCTVDVWLAYVFCAQKGWRLTMLLNYAEIDKSVDSLKHVRDEQMLLGSLAVLIVVWFAI